VLMAHQGLQEPMVHQDQQDQSDLQVFQEQLVSQESQVSPDTQDDQEHKVPQVQQAQQEFPELMALPDQQALKDPKEQLVQLVKLEQRV